MKGNEIKKCLALTLALVLMLPFACFAEALDTDDIDVALEVVATEAAVPEMDEALLPNDADDAPEATDAGEAGDDAGEVAPSDGDQAQLPEQGDAADGDAGKGNDDARQDDAPQTPSVALEKTSLKLGQNEKYTLKLKNGVSAESVGAVFTSSNTDVATVTKTTGKITAKEKGTATITLKTADGTVCTCAVKVLKAPTKVSISSSKLTLGVGEEATLKGSVHTSSASMFTFSSNKPKIVRADANGHIVALKTGTAKVTVKTFNGKKATCTVTVKAAPKSVSFGEDAVSVWKGDSYTASVKLSKKSAGKYTLTSSDPGVVSVSGTKLKGVSLGSATVTVTTYNGMTDTMTVNVRHKPVYRALLIGESTFPGTGFGDLPAKKDVSMMKKMLDSTMGATKSKWSVTTRYDRTNSQIETDIARTFAGAQEGDVSLFYISTHGDEMNSFKSSTPEYAGYLLTYPDDQYTNMYERHTMTLVCLASRLGRVPGQVIVIIDSCGSGAAIYGAKGNAASANAAKAEFDPASFDESVVEAFESQDKGVMAPGVDEGAFVIQNKFFVLTSAGYQEACWTCEGKYSYFTKWLTDGIGTKGSMKADSNKNKLTTLNELYKYIKKRCEKTTIEPKKGVKYKQHVQVYPSGSGFGLFYRK